MRNGALNEIYSLALKNEKIFFIGSDLGFKVLEHFNENLPNQFRMEGVSEANIVGMSAGLSHEGYIVYINTIATFLTRRCFDQVFVNLGVDNSNVRLMASGGGLVYGPLGPTHTSLEDIALMRSVPNMSIVAPADKKQMIELLKQTVTHQGPIYFRIGRGGEEEVSENQNIVFGKANVYKEGNDICLCTTGTMLQTALKVSEKLEKDGLSVELIHLPTIVPLDIKALLNSFKNKKKIYTIEEHFKKGGLFSEIVEAVSGLGSFNITAFSINELYSKNYGRQGDLLKIFELDEESIYKKIKKDFF